MSSGVASECLEFHATDVFNISSPPPFFREIARLEDGGGTAHAAGADRPRVSTEASAPPPSPPPRPHVARHKA